MANPSPAQQLRLQTDTLGDNLLSEWMQPYYYPWLQTIRALASVNRALAAASFDVIADMEHKATESIRRILGFYMRIEARVRQGLRSKKPTNPAKSGRQRYWGDRRMFPRGSYFEATMRQSIWEELVSNNRRRLA